MVREIIDCDVLVEHLSVIALRRPIVNRLKQVRAQLGRVASRCHRLAATVPLKRVQVALVPPVVQCFPLACEVKNLLLLEFHGGNSLDARINDIELEVRSGALIVLGIDVVLPLLVVVVKPLEVTEVLHSRSCVVDVFLGTSLIHHLYFVVLTIVVPLSHHVLGLWGEIAQGWQSSLDLRHFLEHRESCWVEAFGHYKLISQFTNNPHRHLLVLLLPSSQLLDLSFERLVLLQTALKNLCRVSFTHSKLLSEPLDLVL